MEIPTQLTRQTPINIAEFLAQGLEPSVKELYWAIKPGRLVNKYTGEFAKDLAFFSLPVMKQDEWNQTLLETVTDASNMIHRASLRGSANLVIFNEALLPTFESLVAYKPQKERSSVPQFDDVEKVGEMMMRYDMLLSKDLPKNRILVARLGEGFEYKLKSTVGGIPEVDLCITKDPRFYKNELSWWTFVNVLDMEE